jgi:hypothetical protein
MHEYRYCLHGITLRSEIPLALPEGPAWGLTHVQLRSAGGSYFAEATRDARFEQPDSSWYRHCCLPDRSSYVRWDGIGEFLVSADGSTIECRRSEGAAAESFQIYLLGQVLSFALVRRGFEPLHATAVVIDGEAVVFLGESGFGKSTLAACFLEAGHQMLTDDLLVLRERAGRILAHPGPPRIKLFPKPARTFLGDATVGTPMNAGTPKLVLPLEGWQSCADTVPVRTIYALASPRSVSRIERIRIERLSPRAAFIELTKNTFNYRVLDTDRLQRQFTETASLVAAAHVKKVFYARALSLLPAVRDAILSDCRTCEAVSLAN